MAAIENMDILIDKKLNPYLYPFKMKILEDKPLYLVQRNIQRMLIEIDTDLVVQSVTNRNQYFQPKCTHVTIPNMVLAPDKSTVSLETPKTMAGIYERPETMYIALERPKNSAKGLEKSSTDTQHRPKFVHTFGEQKYTDLILNMTTIETQFKPTLMNIAFERPEFHETTLERPTVSEKVIENSDPLYNPKKSESNITPKQPMFKVNEIPDEGHERPKSHILYMRPELTEAIERPIPKEISWTTEDHVRKKLSMVPIRVRVAMGVFAGIIATTTVHPLDVIKVRLQLFPKKISTMHMMQRIVWCEGHRGLYAGLTAGILRQLTYTGARLAVYNTLYDHYKETHGEYPEFGARLQIGVVAGLVGAFMGVPSEVALVRTIEIQRMRVSRCSPPCAPSCKYVKRPENVIRQLIRIAHREGVGTWWRGVVPSLVRSVFVTTAQLGVYSQVRAAFTRGDYVHTGIYLHMCTAGVSSIFSAVLSLPVDQVKTRYQSFIERKRTVPEIFKDMLKEKGVGYLWKGFLPYYVRQAVHTMITYTIVDGLVDAYVDVHFKDKDKR